MGLQVINYIINRILKTKLSYSQCGEDLIVDFIFSAIEPGKITGSYIDIGAHHPLYLNNTYLFYRKGWSGINIDPIKENINLFNNKRPRDLNLCLGVGDITEEKDFYVMDPKTLSSFNKAYVDKCITHGHKLKRIDRVTFQSVKDFIKYNRLSNDVDLLTIDTEESEWDAIKGFWDCGIFPKVIICESVEYSPRLNKSIKERVIIDNILKYDYFVYADTYINTVFIYNEFWKQE
jgi:hypothetical protein